MSAAFSTELPWSCYERSSNQYPPTPSTGLCTAHGNQRQLERTKALGLTDASLPCLLLDSCPYICMIACEAVLPGGSTTRVEIRTTFCSRCFLHLSKLLLFSWSNVHTGCFNPLCFPPSLLSIRALVDVMADFMCQFG